MAVFKEWPGIRYIMQLIIVNLVSCLACLFAIAFAQLELGEAVTGSVSFPDGAIASIGNLAVFLTCVIRGRLDLENGARDVLATNRGPNLREIKGSGLTTCDGENYEGPNRREIKGSGLTTCDGENYEDAKVVMLSWDTSNLNSISQFMKYVHHSYGVDSILLKCLPLQYAGVSAELCVGSHDHRCGCVVLLTEEEKIALMIDYRMPGNLKRLSNSECLLLCSNCLINGCHGCMGDLKVERHTCIRLQSADVKAEFCCDQFHECNCNVLWTDEEEISMMVARWRRGTVKRLSNSLCLLPSWDCLRRGCHGLLQTEEEYKAESCGQIQDVEEITRWLEERVRAESCAAVCQMLDKASFSPVIFDCICIPLCERDHDEWTKLMIRFMSSKEIIVEASGANHAMQEYIDCSGKIGEISHAIIGKTYFPRSLIRSLIVPRLIEVSLNIVLVGWLRGDGLSSSLIARRVVRDHLVDSKGTGFNANAFLTEAHVFCNQTSICQMLRFRGKFLRVRTLSYIIGSVNLICAMIWCVLMACNGRYGIHSMPPSKPSIVVMLASIGVALVIDFVELIFTDLIFFRERFMVWAVIILQIGYIVSGSVMVAKGMGTGKWVYSAFQALIWVKWGIGSYLLGDGDDRGDRLKKRFTWNWNTDLDWQLSPGNMLYSSVFMLNAILAGARGKWEY